MLFGPRRETCLFFQYTVNTVTVDYLKAQEAGSHDISCYIIELFLYRNIPDIKFHGANMGSTGVLSAPDGPHDGHMSLVIRDSA